MSNYFVKDNKITVTSNFDARATLFSGQVFRVKTLAENKFFVVSGEKVAIVETDVATLNHASGERSNLVRVATNQASGELLNAEKRTALQATAPQANPQQATAPQANPQQATAPQANPQQATAPQANPQQTTAPQANPQQATAPQANPQQTTAPQANPQQASSFQSTTITCNDVEYFVEYFDLKNDYSNYLSDVTDEYALSAIGFSPSLKILSQDPFETVIDFIMSANNNIKRFSHTLELIAEKYGEKRVFEGIYYYTFPTASQLSTATAAELKALGAGYRDKYIVETSRQIARGFDFSCVRNLDTLSANKKLCELMGVGEKVADCILLFAFQKYDAFPVDTWIERLYHENYAGTSLNRKEIRKFFVDKFGAYAGIVQQYLFFFKRS